MRVAILGAGGQLAHDLAQAMAGWDLALLRHADLDVCDHALAQRRLAEIRPQVVINTTAFQRVDACESEWEQAFAVNAYAVRNLACVARDLGAALVHLSTDYVFDGEKGSPYIEEDLPQPLNVYGVSKLAGEHFARALCPQSIVVRSSGLFGVAGSNAKGGNFVETMIRLAAAGTPIRVVADQVLAPTSTRDLAAAIRVLVEREARGLYHYAGDGECSWFEFARAIFDLSGMAADLTPTTSAGYGAKARRPKYSVLSTSKALARGAPPPRPWREALQGYLEQRPAQQRLEAH